MSHLSCFFRVNSFVSILTWRDTLLVPTLKPVSFCLLCETALPPAFTAKGNEKADGLSEFLLECLLVRVHLEKHLRVYLCTILETTLKWLHISITI